MIRTAISPRLATSTVCTTRTVQESRQRVCLTPRLRVLLSGAHMRALRGMLLGALLAATSAHALEPASDAGAPAPADEAATPGDEASPDGGEPAKGDEVEYFSNL